MSTKRFSSYYTLAILFAINLMNFFDRKLPAALNEDIKMEWDLSDQQLGWIGTAFTMLYAIVGLPLGRLADVWRRKWILAIGVALWSILTAASGLAWGFWSLFFIRLGVGVGEASCAPVASSLVGDSFPPEKKARAMSIFMIGLPLGLGLSLMLGGIIAQHYSWRTAFYVAAIPGLILAVMALFIQEPERGSADVGLKSADSDGKSSFMDGVRKILKLPTMWWIILSGALHNFNMYALGLFIVSYFIRYHEVSKERAGILTGLSLGLGAVSIFIAGWMGDLAFRKRVDGRLIIAWVSLLLAVPCLFVFLAIPPGNAIVCAIFLLLSYFMMYIYYGTVYAAIHDIIEPRLRGLAMAVYFCAFYLLGAVWGSVGIGIISDYFTASAERGELQIYGRNGDLLPPEAVGLHYAMYIVPLLTIFLVGVLYMASKTVTRDRERLLAGSDSQGKTENFEENAP